MKETPNHPPQDSKFWDEMKELGIIELSQSSRLSVHLVVKSGYRKILLQRETFWKEEKRWMVKKGIAMPIDKYYRLMELLKEKNGDIMAWYQEALKEKINEKQ